MEGKGEQVVACVYHSTRQDLSQNTWEQEKHDTSMGYLPPDLGLHDTPTHCCAHCPLIVSFLVVWSECKPLLLPALSCCQCRFSHHFGEASLAHILPFLTRSPGPAPSLLARGSGPLTFWLYDIWIFYLGSSQDQSKTKPTSHYKS